MSGPASLGTLLIVEDEPMISRILQHKLLREGWRVLVREDVGSAEEALRSEAVSLALVDASLDADGLAWAGGLRDAGMAPLHGWVALVEARDPAAPGRALGHGAAGVVVKPFKPTVVAAEMRRIAGLAAAP